MNNIKFNSVLIIGLGLIGSSLAHAIKKKKLSDNIYGLDIDLDNILKCKKLDLLTKGEINIENFNQQFDLILICSPLGTYKKIFFDLNSYITDDTLIADVGSTKLSSINDFKEIITNKHLLFVPSHPIAGLEKSGPDFGFAELFDNRFCIITPFNQNTKSIDSITKFWKSIGMQVQTMEAEHHDRVLAMTSHIPQLIAYSIVSTATELESQLKDEVLKYSAAGFRDFTRLAGSDPIMWRDIYSMNKEAVLEMLERFTKDLSILQNAISNEDLSFLEKTFRSTRSVRKIIEDLGQAGTFDPTEKNKK